MKFHYKNNGPHKIYMEDVDGNKYFFERSLEESSATTKIKLDIIRMDTRFQKTKIHTFESYRWLEDSTIMWFNGCMELVDNHLIELPVLEKDIKITLKKENYNIICKGYGMPSFVCNTYNSYSREVNKDACSLENFHIYYALRPLMHYLSDKKDLPNGIMCSKEPLSVLRTMSPLIIEGCINIEDFKKTNKSKVVASEMELCL